MTTAAWQVFTQDKRKAGWPATMTPRQLARLQRPFSAGSDAEGCRRADALAAAISDACAAGAIEHTNTTGPACQVPGNRQAEVVPGVFRTVHFVKTVPGPVGWHISASAFAAWLTAQGIEQSAHISAWCKSQGVAAISANTAPMLQLVSPVATKQEQIAAVLAELQPPERIRTGLVSWKSVANATQLLRAYEALMAAGCKSEEALQEIADKWQSGAGSSLRKQLPKCRNLLKPAPRRPQRSAG